MSFCAVEGGLLSIFSHMIFVYILQLKYEYRNHPRIRELAVEEGKHRPWNLVMFVYITLPLSFKSTHQIPSIHLYS